MIKNKYVAFAVFVILFLVIWNALRYFQGMYKDGFDIMDGLVFPLTVAVICGYVTYLRRDWPVKKNGEEQADESEKK